MYSEEYEDEEDEEQESGNFFVNFYNNNKILVWIFGGIILFIILVSLFSKGGSNTPIEIKYDVLIYPEGDVHVNIGRSVNLIATVKNDPKGTVTWTVGDENIVSVDNGNVKGLAYGTTTVTATYIDKGEEKHTATKNVTVADGDPNVQLTDVSFKDGDLFMPLNSDYQIALALTPSRGYVLNESFSSSNNSVVVVDNKGLVHSVGEGDAEITFDVNNGQFRKSLNVHVSRDYNVSEIVILPESISFDGEVRKVKIGSTERLTYTVKPQYADVEKLIWTSSNLDVVAVENGIIKALKEGRSVVTVTALNGVNDQIDIEVLEDIVEVTDIEVTDIELSDSQIELEVGKSKTIKPVVKPDDASNKALEYTSTDDYIAYVEPNDTGTQAVITGISEGEVTIVISSTNNVEKMINVKVTDPNSSEEQDDDDDDDDDWGSEDWGGGGYSGGGGGYSGGGGGNVKKDAEYSCEMKYDTKTFEITITGTASNGSKVKKSEIDGKEGTKLSPSREGYYSGKVTFEDDGVATCELKDVKISCSDIKSDTICNALRPKCSWSTAGKKCVSAEPKITCTDRVYDKGKDKNLVAYCEFGIIKQSGSTLLYGDKPGIYKVECENANKKVEAECKLIDKDTLPSHIPVGYTENEECSDGLEMAAQSYCLVPSGKECRAQGTEELYSDAVVCDTRCTVECPENSGNGTQDDLYDCERKMLAQSYCTNDKFQTEDEMKAHANSGAVTENPYWACVLSTYGSQVKWDKWKCVPIEKKVDCSKITNKNECATTKGCGLDPVTLKCCEVDKNTGKCIDAKSSNPTPATTPSGSGGGSSGGHGF